MKEGWQWLVLLRVSHRCCCCGTNEWMSGTGIRNEKSQLEGFPSETIASKSAAKRKTFISGGEHRRQQQKLKGLSFDGWSAKGSSIFRKRNEEQDEGENISHRMVTQRLVGL